nr:o phosphoseryl tRNA(Sec) selenium [Hymenolepis microstoma]
MHQLIELASQEQISRYVGTSHAQRATDRISGIDARFNNILQTGCLPEIGFSEAEIESIINRLSLMDSNNWSHSTGVGEREGRILLDLVRRRHFGLAHGIGRSGDITAIQPKAPGSSLINRLCNSMLLDWLRRSGAPSTEACLLVPMATGMTLTFCLLTLKKHRGPQAKYVIWPRIDQKSCLKCISAAGLIPIPIEPLQTAGRTKKKNKGARGSGEGKAEKEDLEEEQYTDQLSSNIAGINNAMIDPQSVLEARDGLPIPNNGENRPGPESIVCVLTTTSCFSPRVPDRLSAITRLCKKYGNIPHLVNNAYGVQSKRCMGLIECAWTEAKSTQSEGNSTQSSPPLDLLYVQSTDKNLMVPVGGAIIAGFSKDLIKEIAESYPGRASGTPSLDVFATLLHLGRRGWESLCSKQETCYAKLAEGLKELADKHGLRLMNTSENSISLALSLKSLHTAGENDLAINPDLLTQIGSRLFTQGCSGVRVVVPASMEKHFSIAPKCIGGVTLVGFNSHSCVSKEAYMNAAAALGQTPEEIDLFLTRLDKALTTFKRQLDKKSSELLPQQIS